MCCSSRTSSGDEASTIADVHSFLGVRPADRRRRAAADEPRLAAPEQAQRGASRQRQGATSRSGYGSTTLRSRLRVGLLKQATPPPMDPAARTLLTEIYRPEVGRLAELLGRPAAVGAQMAGGSAPALPREGPGSDEVPVRARRRSLHPADFRSRSNRVWKVDHPVDAWRGGKRNRRSHDHVQRRSVALRLDLGVDGLREAWLEAVDLALRLPAADASAHSSASLPQRPRAAVLCHQRRAAP